MSAFVAPAILIVSFWCFFTLGKLGGELARSKHPVCRVAGGVCGGLGTLLAVSYSAAGILSHSLMALSAVMLGYPLGFWLTLRRLKAPGPG
ncbi:MAG: hypothetical protein IT210_11910 [Armatimonadetes bacterium]|nr:hypothetical protein [Armatimonadota bacterium]